jgi:biopolymer transport protein ExbB/TolQ
MAFRPTPSHVAEWPLLVLALALVAAIGLPLWQWQAADAGPTVTLTPERLGRMFLGPEQLACYACFTWATLILLVRYVELRRQRRAFRLDLVAADEGLRILPEDARPLMRRVEQLAQGGPYFLADLLRLALGRFALSRSAREAGDLVRAQAELELGRMSSGMATIHYLAWAIPAIGFVGTVRHIGLALAITPDLADDALASFLSGTTRYLAVAFDTTLVALLLSLVLMFLLHSVQRDQEAVVLDCQQYCLENLLNRLYDLPADGGAAGADALAGGFAAEKPWQG